MQPVDVDIVGLEAAQRRFGGALQQGIFELHGNDRRPAPEMRNGLRFRDLPGRKIRKADVAERRTTVRCWTRSGISVAGAPLW